MNILGKVGLTLCCVVVIGLLAITLIQKSAGGANLEHDDSNFTAGSRKYSVAYAAAGSYYRAAKIDVNRASLSELIEIKGIGPVLAKKIIDYRQKNGYFQAVTELQNISGIGPILLKQLELAVEIPVTDTINQKGNVIE